MYCLIIVLGNMTEIASNDTEEVMASKTESRGMGDGSGNLLGCFYSIHLKMEDGQHLKYDS
jgi:hypothetical protein